VPDDTALEETMVATVRTHDQLTGPGKFHPVRDILQRGVIAKLIPFHPSTLLAISQPHNVILSSQFGLV
jgi:hypothetical protein